MAGLRASSLDLVACTLYMNGKKKKAVSTIEEAIALAQKDEGLSKRLAAFNKK